MLTLKTTTRFWKDYKLAKKIGLDISLLEDVIVKLLTEEVLDEKYKDHELKENYKGFRECHIQPDWLLIYAVDKKQQVLIASRTGTHSDLYGK